MKSKFLHLRLRENLRNFLGILRKTTQINCGNRKGGKMNAIHIILQGKGGVGKSLVAALLAQYLEGKSNLFCADTDPVNDTFAKYSAFGAERVKILNADKNID